MSDIIPQKTCYRCGESKPATKEFFTPAKKMRDGLRNECKTCRQKSRRKITPHLPHSKYVPVPEGFKRCSGCQQVLPATQDFFYYRSRKKDHLYEYCKECGRKKSTQYNRDIGRQPQKPADPENKKRWLEANRERRREQEKQRRLANPEQFQTNKRRYRQSEHGKLKTNTYSRNRKMRIKGLEGFYTVEDIQDMYKKQQGLCHWCYTELYNTYEVDHVIAITLEGSTNWPENLVLACPFCNQSKGNKTLEEWHLYLEKFILSGKEKDA